MTHDTALSQSIEEAVAARLADRTVVVTLGTEGEGVARQLGPAWFGSAVGSLALAYPEHRLEITMTTSASEPICAPTEPTRAELDRAAEVGRIVVSAARDGAGTISRTLRLPGASILDGTAHFQFQAHGTLLRRVVGGVYGFLYHRAPVLLDEWRQMRNTLGWRLARDEPASGPDFSHVPVPAAPTQDSPVAWFALHWLEPGGAESWAFESAAIAARAGFRVVITVGVPAPQRLLDRALSITPDVYLAANALAEDDWEPFLVNLLDTRRPRLVFVHHSGRAYTALPALRQRYPDTLVIDTTHIREYRTGGFVATSMQYTDQIDVHHVISPQLRTLYTRASSVDTDKVVYHPLTHPGDAPRAEVPQRPARSGPLRLGFLGRLTSQKRPLLFVELAARLEKHYPGEFEFVMQGDGVLAPRVQQRLAHTGLVGKVVQRAWGPIEDFMRAIDVLVISSENEGLTLTTLEAQEHGVLVLSADVGSQRDVIAPMLLVPRRPARFLAQAVERLHTITGSPDALAAARRQQTEKITALNGVESAGAYFARLFRDLKEKY